ncbi:MAG: hypothetical protein WBX22_29535 [Silvibacterium sp.]
MNQKEAQVGFDLFYRSGVTQGLPAMMPIVMLYDTPDNAAAEIRYLENRKYPISYIEMAKKRMDITCFLKTMPRSIFNTRQRCTE